MNNHIWLAASLLLALTVPACAQNSVMQNTLNNHDIVILAEAGFNENFIGDFISMSRTRFDTSVAGLAELAKEGLSERLIRMMLSAAAAPQTNTVAAAPLLPAEGVVPTTLVAAMESNRRKRGSREKESSMAISNQAPYYRTSSIFWGFWKAKTGVGVGMRSPDPPMALQLGAAYNQALSAPVGVSARYVIIP